MKKRSFIMGMVTMLMVMMLIPNSFAASVLQTIEVAFNPVNITLDGKVVGESGKNYTTSNGSEMPVTFIYNGNTYMAVKKLSETLGLQIGWDGNSNTIILESDDYQLKQAANESPADFATRSNPLKPGEGVIMSIDTYDDINYVVAATLTESIRGSEANELVANANMFNDPPKDGYEYLLAKFDFEVKSVSDPNKAFDLNDSRFTLISESGKAYDQTWTVAPEPSIDADLYEGSTHSGYVVFEVAVDDANPLIAYYRDYDGSGGSWFSLK